LNESQYLKATNRVKVSMALVILRDVLPGKDYGITSDEISEIRRLLSNAEDKLFGSYSLDEKE
jgi:hypothetical protein